MRLIRFLLLQVIVVIVVVVLEWVVEIQNTELTFLFKISYFGPQYFLVNHFS